MIHLCLSVQLRLWSFYWRNVFNFLIITLDSVHVIEIQHVLVELLSKMNHLVFLLCFFWISVYENRWAINEKQVCTSHTSAVILSCRGWCCWGRRSGCHQCGPYCCLLQQVSHWRGLGLRTPSLVLDFSLSLPGPSVPSAY